MASSDRGDEVEGSLLQSRVNRGAQRAGNIERSADALRVCHTPIRSPFE